MPNSAEVVAEKSAIFARSLQDCAIGNTTNKEPTASKQPL